MTLPLINTDDTDQEIARSAKIAKDRPDIGRKNLTADDADNTDNTDLKGNVVRFCFSDHGDHPITRDHPNFPIPPLPLFLRVSKGLISNSGDLAILQS